MMVNNNDNDVQCYNNLANSFDIVTADGLTPCTATSSAAIGVD